MKGENAELSGIAIWPGNVLGKMLGKILTKRNTTKINDLAVKMGGRGVRAPPNPILVVRFKILVEFLPGKILPSCLAHFVGKRDRQNGYLTKFVIFPIQGSEVDS